MTAGGRRLAIATAVTALLLTGPGPASFAQSNTVQAIRYGTITSMERTTIIDKPSSTGAMVGSTTGAVAGYALADHGDRWLGSLVGGVLGGAAGGAAAKSAAKKKGWQLVVKLDNGQEIGVQVPGKKKKHEVGDRVRLMTGPDGKTQVSTVDE
jgi:outer membrane lipoprotein SlyB